MLFKIRPSTKAVFCLRFCYPPMSGSKKAYGVNILFIRMALKYRFINQYIRANHKN